MPPAAMTPDWRMAPPRRCFHCQARSMKSAGPARTPPTGAPRPLLRSSQTESNEAANSFAGTPEATAAFRRRAPSMCASAPHSWAAWQTSWTCLSGQTRPPPMFVVCSTETRRKGGRWREACQMVSRTCRAVNMPFFPSMG